MARKAREPCTCRLALPVTRAPAELYWASLTVPADLGLDLDLYKWRQNQARGRAK